MGFCRNNIDTDIGPQLWDWGLKWPITSHLLFNVCGKHPGSKRYPSITLIASLNVRGRKYGVTLVGLEECVQTKKNDAVECTLSHILPVFLKFFHMNYVRRNFLKIYVQSHPISHQGWCILIQKSKENTYLSTFISGINKGVPLKLFLIWIICATFFIVHKCVQLNNRHNYLD